MTNDAFFPILRNALRREEARHVELSNRTRIGISALGDVMCVEDEWYSVVPLYKLRILCSTIDVNFDEIFNVPPFQEAFKIAFYEAFDANMSRLMDKLYMADEFWCYLKIDTSLLNLHPLKLTSDIAGELGIQLPVVMSILGRME